MSLSSVFRFSRAAYPTLTEDGGKIINIGSMYSIFGSSLVSSYAAGKAASSSARLLTEGEKL